MTDFNLFNTPLIVDFGSGQVKADFSGEEEPKVIFDSWLGKPKYSKVLPIMKETDVIGPSADVRGLYKLEHAIERGVISSSNVARQIIDRVYNDLKITNTKDVPFFICEPPFTPKSQKQMLAELLFDTYDSPTIFFGSQGVLSLYAFGKTNGIVLESGEGLTQVVPIYNGYKIENSIEKIKLGGQDVTNYLKLLLKKNGVSINSASEDLLLKEIKESVCELQSTPFEEFRLTSNSKHDQMDKKTDEIKYSLPDGSQIPIEYERFMASEILFNPSIAGHDSIGIGELINSAFKKLDLDLRKQLYGNIFVSGGNTMLNGFSERLAFELGQQISNKTKLSIIAPNSKRSLLVWQGASAITNMNAFSKLWITKSEYHENGDRIFFTKSF